MWKANRFRFCQSRKERIPKIKGIIANILFPTAGSSPSGNKQECAASERERERQRDEETENVSKATKGNH